MEVYIGNTGHRKKHKKSKTFFGPGNPKTRFLRFVQIILRKTKGNLGIPSETTISGISSETAAPWDLE